MLPVRVQSVCPLFAAAEDAFPAPTGQVFSRRASGIACIPFPAATLIVTLRARLWLGLLRAIHTV